MKFRTKTIHIGSEPNLQVGASGDVMPPIHLSTTFARKNVTDPTGGYEYSRSGNPTRFALEKVLVALEDGKSAFTYSSGLAAITNILMLLRTGDHIVVIDDVYGGTRRLFQKVFASFGITSTFGNFSGEDVRAYIQKNTKMVWVESPTNPLLKIVDIAAVANVTQQEHILLVVDNTFATPYFQKPLACGASIVTHSLTKYLGGHSDVVGGAVIVTDPILAERLQFLQNAVGAILSPFDSYSAIRGIKTLALRMEAHEKNAQSVVAFLRQHPKIKRVYYPGLENHVGHAIAKKQMSGFGGVVSFEIDGDRKAVFNFLEALKIIHIAESLGAVESLIEHPASMTHASISPSERASIGISDSLVRLSVGVEGISDLLDDLKQALQHI